MDIGYVTNVCIYTHIQCMYRHLCMCECVYIYIHTCVRIYIYTYIHIELDRFINYTHMCTCIFHLLITCLMITSMASRRGCLSYVFLWIAWTFLIFIIVTWWNFQDPCPSKKSPTVLDLLLLSSCAVCPRFLSCASALGKETITGCTCPAWGG